MFNNMAELQGLLSLWRRNEDAGAQRAAWMYGYYTPDPNYPSGTRVVVEALYEPPQAFEKTMGAIRLLPDAKKQKVADAIAGAAGLRRVGLFFTKRPKFPGDPELAPRELLAMATLQNAFPQSAGLPGSQFVTVVARADAQDQVAPQGYQATDQMMALVRDGVLADATPLDTRMKVKPTVPGEPPLPEVIDSSFKRGRQRVSEFDVERGLVTIETGAPTGKPSDPKPLYKHTAFPVENRSEYGVEQGNKDLKKLLALYKDEPMQSRLSDFHALLYLAQAFDVDTAAGIARAVRAGKPIEEGYQLMLEHLE